MSPSDSRQGSSTSTASGSPTPGPSMQETAQSDNTSRTRRRSRSFDTSDSDSDSDEAPGPQLPSAADIADNSDDDDEDDVGPPPPPSDIEASGASTSKLSDGRSTNGQRKTLTTLHNRLRRSEKPSSFHMRAHTSQICHLPTAISSHSCTVIQSTRSQ